jgi:integrase/recombinase XerD
MPKGDLPAEPLTAAEVKALLVACAGDTLSGMRNHALLVMLWRAGLRIGEALDLRPSDVDFGAGTVRVLHTKTRQARTVGLDDAALAVLAAWLGARSAAGITTGPLFCRLHGQPGAPLSSRYVRAQMTRLAVKAGLQHRVHPHGMRHTMAVELRKEGWPIPEISRQLGHRSIGTTQVYVDHLYPAEVIDRARARTWA